MRPPAPNGCSDQACQEETALLDDDSLVSDVRPPAPGQFASVCLCTHHRQLYQTASAKRKCGVLICYRVAKGAKHGVPLCFEHMEEHEGGGHSRKDSPHPRGLFVGLRRRFNRKDSSARSRSPHPGQGQRSGHQDGPLREGPRIKNTRKPYQSEEFQPHHGHILLISARLAYHHHNEDPQEDTPPGPRFGSS